MRQDAHEHGFIVGIEIGKDFGNVGRRKLGQNFAELGEIALANQLDQFGLEKVPNHATSNKAWNNQIAKEKGYGIKSVR